MGKKLNPQEIIDDVLSVRDMLGDISKTLYLKHGKYSECAIISHFGNWTKLSKQLGFKDKTNYKVSKEDVITDVQKVFSETNNTTRENYLSHGKYSRAPINRLFGSWNNLLKELNYSINMNKDINKEEVSSAIMALYNKYGYITAELQRKELGYSQPVIDRLYGSFSKMLVELNIRAPYGKAISDEEVKKSLIDIYNKHGYISVQLIDEYAPVSFATVCNRFGSLYEICEELSIPTHTNDDISKLSRFVLGVVNEYLNATPQYEKTFSWLKNEFTNKRLRVDAYYTKHNLIVEVDGKQHYSPNSFFYGDEETFLYRIFLDEVKENLIKKHNIKFVRFTYKDNKNSIISKLKQVLSNS